MKYTAAPLLSRIPCSLVVALAGSLIAGSSWAAPPATDGLWHGAVSLGGSLSSGNTSNKVLTANADAALATQLDKITLYGQANYASTKSNGTERSTSADSLRLGGRYDRDLSGELFAFGAGEYQTDKVQGLSGRESVQVGLGYHVLRTDSTSFDVFAGIGGAHASYTNLPSGSSFETILGEESTHKISETTQFKQRLTTHIASGEVGRLTTWDLTLSTALAGQWTLNTGLSLRNASVVAPGSKKTDSLLTVGLGYKF